MLEGIFKGLLQWLYGLFLDIISYSANALLSVMSTNLTYFELKVPIVTSLYQIFIAIGWGLLIGNLAFQSMKAMFAGLGFETESPFILMFRTLIFGTLLIFSRDICDMCLSITKNIIELLGIPKSVTITMPTEAYFTSNSSWLLVIIIGFILGFQLIKLFFEIGERYVIVAVLTLLMPIGLSMGGSKSTRDICTGYFRTYTSMLVLMVVNVLFLKLILSALSSMPMGIEVLPWCLLVVGLAKTARKTDNLLSRIGMNPAITGDSLGSGRGIMLAAMAARTIMSASGRTGRIGSANSKSGNKNTNNNATPTYNGNNNYANGGTNVKGDAVFEGSTRNGEAYQSDYKKGGNSNSNFTANGSSRFGTATYNSTNPSRKNFSVSGKGVADTGTRINTDRFGIQKPNTTVVAGNNQTSAGNKKGGTNQPIQKSGTVSRQNQNSKGTNKFDTGNNKIRHNPNPLKPTRTYTPITPEDIISENSRFGSEKQSKFSDKNILITRDDNDG